MIYLKLFESQDICEYYCELSEDEYNECINGDCENFTQSEIDRLKNLNKITDFLIFNYSYSIKIEIYSDNYLYSNGILIYKCEDEWFYVNDLNYASYFKCDQFDGLLKCIEKELC